MRSGSRCASAGASSTGSTSTRTAPSRSTRCARRGRPGAPRGDRARRGRHPLVVDPGARREDRRDPGGHQRDVVPGRANRASTTASARSSAALEHANMLASVEVLPAGRVRRVARGARPRAGEHRARRGGVAGRVRQVPRPRRRGRHRARRSPARRSSPTARTLEEIVRNGRGEMPAVGSRLERRADRRADRLPARRARPVAVSSRSRSTPPGSAAGSRAGSSRPTTSGSGSSTSGRRSCSSCSPGSWRMLMRLQLAQEDVGPARPRPLQRARHDPRDGDGLPRRRADPRRASRTSSSR